jgi:serine/threonine protein kinase
VDIWAVATILGEMINGRPVFPGTSTINQIERIIEVINLPSKADIDAIQSVYTATMLESLPPMNYKLLGDVFPQASSEAIDLIRSCFHFNPNKRPSAEELLKVSGGRLPVGCHNAWFAGSTGVDAELHCGMALRMRSLLRSRCAIHECLCLCCGTVLYSTCSCRSFTTRRKNPSTRTVPCVCPSTTTSRYNARNAVGCCLVPSMIAAHLRDSHFIAVDTSDCGLLTSH